MAGLGLPWNNPDGAIGRTRNDPDYSSGIVLRGVARTCAAPDWGARSVLGGTPRPADPTLTFCLRLKTPVHPPLARCGKCEERVNGKEIYPSCFRDLIGLGAETGSQSRTVRDWGAQRGPVPVGELTIGRRDGHGTARSPRPRSRFKNVTNDRPATGRNGAGQAKFDRQQSAGRHAKARDWPARRVECLGLSLSGHCPGCSEMTGPPQGHRWCLVRPLDRFLRETATPAPWVSVV